MKAEYLNPFISAAVDVLEQFVPDIEIERGEPDVIEEPTPTLGTATLIGISGELEGRVLYIMNREAAVGIAEQMNGEDFPGLNEMVRSTIQELCNIISGNAAQELQKNAEDKDIELSPPSMVIGPDTEVSDSITSNLIQVPLQTNYGEIIINLAVREHCRNQ